MLARAVRAGGAHLGIRVEVLEAVDEVGTVERVAADADDHRLAEALCGGLVHSLVRQRARARHDTDGASLVKVHGQGSGSGSGSGCGWVWGCGWV